MNRTDTKSPNESFDFGIKMCLGRRHTFPQVISALSVAIFEDQMTYTLTNGNLLKIRIFTVGMKTRWRREFGRNL